MDEAMENEKAHSKLMNGITAISIKVEGLTNIMTGYMNRADKQSESFQEEIKIVHKRISDNNKIMTEKIEKVENKVEKASVFISALVVIILAIIGGLKALSELGVM